MDVVDGLESYHFSGKTIVSGGLWMTQVHVDFHILLEVNSDNAFVDDVSIWLAQLFTKDYVDKRDHEYEVAMMEDNDELDAD